MKNQKTIKKIKHEEPRNEMDKEQQTLDTYRNKPMKNSIEHDKTKFDEEMYELIDKNDLNFCGKQILKQAIEHPETTYKQVQKLEKMPRRTRKKWSKNSKTTQIQKHVKAQTKNKSHKQDTTNK